MRNLQRAAGLGLFLLLGACGGTSGSNSAGGSSGAASAPEVAQASVAPAASVAASQADPSTVAASPAASVRASASAKPSPGPDEFVNPVLDQDFPDPDVLKVGETYYMYATNSGGTNIQTATSTDMVSWQPIGEALPALPGWAKGGFTWAPEVTSWDDGKSFVMYFTARDAASDKQCIGAATSDAPEGPFTGAGDAALICQVDQGGSIDAGSFRDEDGRRYVVWKNDGNCCGYTTYIYLQEVSENGLELLGEPTRLIENDKRWEGNLVEAPTLWKHDGRYYLLYSANNYAGVDYAVGSASADALTGPYQKPDEPLLATDYDNAAALGPGGQDILVAPDGATWLLYHSWDPTVTYRRLMLDELVWENGVPVLKGPDGTPQARP